jgi:formylglycine-generating enzyme required for sulfatase activity
MAWPTATDYNEAVQDLRQSVGDEELREGQAAVNPLGLPMIWSGNFADVYKIHNAKSGNTWALKCFTRKIAGQADRYQHISTHLDRARLPFMVDFKYLDQGIRIRGEWYPALKMRWVEGGIPLNQFVEQYLNRPRTLKDLLSLWVKMADRLRKAKIAHADLQHGNVLLVPRADRRLALKLIDYDGMHVPALSGSRSAELGHPAFQHPQRGREGIYSAEVDRFSNLAIYSAIHCLTVGREKVWERFNNDDNLLFREDDFRSPADSDVFQTLWHLPDADSRALVGRLILACTRPLDQSPLLDEVTNGQVFPLTSAEEATVESILDSKTQTAPAAVAEPVETASSVPPSEGPTTEPLPSAESEPTVKPLPDWMSLPGTSESATPQRRRTWLSPLAVPRLFDWLLAKIVGEENVILQKFLRVITVSGLLVLIGLFVYAPDYLFNYLGFRAAQVPAESAPLSEDTASLINSLGMKFKLIPAGEFMMGSPEDDPDKKSGETPHRVRITKPFYLGVHEVTQEQYEKVMEKNPPGFKDPSRPVEKVSWDDATAFCAKLSAIDTGFDYRLPTEAEWEYACRAGTRTPYSCGDDLDPQFMWFLDNSDGKTHPVGQKLPNAWGLYDMHGNVREWCQDRYGEGYYSNSALADPVGPTSGSRRVCRGGSWSDSPWICRSANRDWGPPDIRVNYLGFRVAAVPVKSAPLPEDTASPPDPEPEETPAPKPTELPEITNGIGMKFKLIPAGEFMMGSPEDDPDKSDDETPQHRVQITKPFCLGVHEVTQEQYEKVMEKNPSRFKEPSHPVDSVTWDNATAFCAKLSAMDTGFDYRLPTEAEWEYACRAGTTTRYSFGDDLDPQYAWFRGNSDGKTHPVGQKRPNAWGLYDMQGNVAEWCQDWYGERDYANSPLADPVGPASGRGHVLRGGWWTAYATSCRSAYRGSGRAVVQNYILGFRVAAVPAESAPLSEDTAPLLEPEPEATTAPKPAELPEIANSIGMKFKLIPAGEFMMGSKSAAETSQHRVRITKPFYLGVHEVTQEQFEKVMVGNPSRAKEPSRPVEMVSWDDATAFCAKLSAMDTGFDYRLPTEAEWEYACRAGTTTRYSCGDDLDPQFAWFRDNSGRMTHPVGQTRPNGWGLYDMHGNVWEWCQDWFDEDYYANSPSADPAGPTSGSYRVRRGGSCLHDAQYDCTSANRLWGRPGFRLVDIGFRVVLIPAESAPLSEDTASPLEPEPEATIAPKPAPKPTELPGDITNNIGMKFKLIPAGEFMMGSPKDDRDKSGDETPQHRVRITKPFYLGVHEVTQEQYEKVMEENPSRFKDRSRPVERVSWEDATAFCEKLSEMDTRFEYRLPTEAEWEYACRAGTRTRYSCGEDLHPQYAWFRDNSGGRMTHRVGQTRPNGWGLYDMHGNVNEWCQDKYDGGYYANSSLADPVGPTSSSSRVVRGGSWSGGPRDCRSADRNGKTPGSWDSSLGFRVAQVPAESAPLAKDRASPPEPGPEATTAPEPAPKPTELPEITNSIGMKFKLIPAGEFMMGSPEDDPYKRANETPQHRVRITKPFYLGVHEVTQEQYEKVMEENPSHFKEPSRPVERVSWDNATAFCAKLSAMDTGFDYRLPTEAEWEYACRAGTTTRYSCGDDLDPQCAWFRDNSDRKTHPVGQKRPNGWGLYDMHGNVHEWCQDWFGSYDTNSPLADPVGPTSGSCRVDRGGSWDFPPLLCKSAIRDRNTPDSAGGILGLRGGILGFRVAQVPAD